MAVEVNTTYLGTAVFIKLFNFKMRLIQNMGTYGNSTAIVWKSIIMSCDDMAQQQARSEVLKSEGAR